jgi:3D-(3,5/4)-trihydroxycyclohexane-1,2-dione acylhydrolase (decyclizing)
MRVLTSPAETGAVTICLPQYVQAEAGLFADSFFETRVHTMSRALPETGRLQELKQRLIKAKKPLIIAGGGVVYSEAEAELAEFCKLSKIPYVETQAGKGALSKDHPQNLGALGVTGTQCANRIAAEADLILALGTRLSDFTGASGTQFANPKVQFVNINVDSRDAHKYDAFPILADCKSALQELAKERVFARCNTGHGEQPVACRRHGAQCRWKFTRGHAQVDRNLSVESVPHGVWIFLHGLRDCRGLGCQDAES